MFGGELLQLVSAGLRTAPNVRAVLTSERSSPRRSAFKRPGYLQFTGRVNCECLADHVGDPRVTEGVTSVAERYPWTSSKIPEIRPWFIDAGRKDEKMMQPVREIATDITWKTLGLSLPTPELSCEGISRTWHEVNAKLLSVEFSRS
jgi:hypothetical protein